ncbi:glycosyltransferase [Sneathiella chinensis]|uniref:Glycosyltransferase 2-like domain-containing protein n=1 Tax=Sneathiella chinensis TaxID=349750 RepID=A0ABQ5U0N0_9PROT|nr:glycosyltransferase [Sneathiella chinensis]GLQ05762.1 hypothetical protein GCM10007924_09830 [Sneathiella chinensis]
MSGNDSEQDVEVCAVSDQMLKNVRQWQVPLREFVSPANPRTQLKIATIVSEEMYDSLKHVAKLVPLIEGEWQDTLSYMEGIDFLLIEACRESFMGSWYLAQSFNRPLKDELRNVIQLAKDRSIPTVFWNTKDLRHHPQYCDLAAEFDYIFCSDAGEITALAEQGIKAALLKPAIEPMLCNPFRIFTNEEDEEIEVLYDGWSDVLAKHEIRECISGLKKFGVNIVDSVNEIFENKVAETPDLKDLILGSVTKENLRKALKISRIYLTHSASQKTPTDLLRGQLEALASRCVVVHVGQEPVDEMVREYCIHVVDQKDVGDTLEALLGSRVELSLKAQRGWRDVHTLHTYLARIEGICETIGVICDENREEYPLVTLIAPSNRPEFLPNIMHNFDLQAYPNKELIIIFNGGFSEFSELERKVQSYGNQNVRIVYEPEESPAGSCLNDGAFLSNGTYCFRFDDDDIYGVNFISDTLLHLNSIDADIVGKPPCHLYFEETGELYARRLVKSELCVLPPASINQDVVRLGGNSIGGKTDFLRKCRYPDNVFASADSAFLFNAAMHNPVILSTDLCSLLATRREDVGSHTWRVPKAALLKNSVCLDATDAGKFIADLGKSTILHGSTKKTVLFLGPGSFRDGVWRNRAKYIFPDIFSSLKGHANVHILTGKVPDFAKEDIRALEHEFSVRFAEMPDREKSSFLEFWSLHAAEYGKKIGADIITNFFGSVQFPAAASAVAESIGAQSIVRVAGDEISSRIAMGVYPEGSVRHKKDLAMEAEAFQKSSRIIVMSAQEKERVDGIVSEKDKVKVIVRGVDTDSFTPEGKADRKRTTFLFVGRKSLEKGFDLLEKAAGIVYQRNKEIRFLFAGDFEPEVVENKEYIGFVKTEDLPDLYRKADALVMCSRSEGMPQVLLEAMSSALPSIMSKHLFSSWLSEEEVGVFCDLNPVNLAERIIWMHDNPEIACAMGRNAREYALAHFDREKGRQAYREFTLCQKSGQ